MAGCQVSHLIKAVNMEECQVSNLVREVSMAGCQVSNLVRVANLEECQVSLGASLKEASLKCRGLMKKTMTIERSSKRRGRLFVSFLLVLFVNIVA